MVPGGNLKVRKIETFCGSIIDCPTQVIINAANSQVALGSGVSGAIREACGGNAFQRECHEILEELYDDYLPRGEVMATGGGSSQFRWILHAATIDFSQGQYTSQDVVRKSMISILKSAEEIIEENDLDGLSIGVPLLGSDVGGLSIQESCDALCEGMKIYFRGCRDSLISEIHFVHPGEDVIRQVKLILNRHFVI